jgi:hypothetical integral membrane protein (TIGR02206 family)
MPTEFEKGSLLHLLTLLVCAAVIFGAAWLGRRGRDRAPKAERSLRIGWVVFVVVSQAAWQVWQNLPGNFDFRYSLPLYLCDLVVLAIPLALLTRSRPSRSLLYFWGIGLAFFAFLLPILGEGPAHLAFWMFWLGHTQIVGSAVYLVAALGYRPSAGDVRTAFLFTCAYVAGILPFDAAFGVDYGGVGPDPSSTEIFGPWPLRVLVIVILEGALFVLLWLPWRVSSRTPAGREGRASGPSGE